MFVMPEENDVILKLEIYVTCRVSQKILMDPMIAVLCYSHGFDKKHKENKSEGIHF